MPVSIGYFSFLYGYVSFLGIEIDSVRLVIRLPDDKLHKLIGLVSGFCSVCKVSLKQLQSLLGLLVFACRIMPMGRVFLQQVSLATKGVTRPGHRIHLTKPLKADLGVWRDFQHSYNGRTCCQEVEVSSADIFSQMRQGRWVLGRDVR